MPLATEKVYRGGDHLGNAIMQKATFVSRVMDNSA